LGFGIPAPGSPGPARVQRVCDALIAGQQLWVLNFGMVGFTNHGLGFEHEG